MGEEHTCTQEQRIQRIENTMEKLTDQLPSLIAEVRGLKDKMDDILRRQEDHQIVLYGERGQPGLIGNVKGMGDTLKELSEALKGVGEKPGLIAVISDLTDHMKEVKDDRKWMIRLVVGAVITAVLAVVLKP